MGYRVKFPNDYVHIEIPNLNGFKADKEYIFDDEVFGWFGNVYVSVIRKDYARFMEECNR
jgi:hypothetical protein